LPCLKQSARKSQKIKHKNKKSLMIIIRLFFIPVAE
jgi:hypothetical protein